MSKARTRLVNFRLTEEEFEQLKTSSNRQGARCVSDFVRCVVLTPSSRCPVSSTCDESLSSFERRVAALERSITLFIAALSSAQSQPVNSGN
ncbi:MAG: hypothetical protein JWP63_5248 [Candidatus Solibacter sp.]|jgi:hypothetical protein|nr:hypothetical protein [Candidatus Solibacter sp.]